jgi:WD40 repeat protein
VLFSPAGETLVAAGEGYDEKSHRFNGVITVFHVKSGEMKHQFDLPGRVMTAAYSADGALLATAEGLGSGLGDDNEGPCLIRLWDATSGNKRGELRGHTGQIQSVGFLPDGKTLASVSEDKTLRLWDLGSGAEIDKYTIDGHLSGRRDGLQRPARVRAAVFDPDFKVAYTSGLFSDTVIGWDIASGKRVSVLRMEGCSGSELAMSPDGKVLAASYHGYPERRESVRLWEVSSGKELQRFEIGTMPARALTFSPDGKRLASAVSNGTALVWDLTGPANVPAE